MTVLEQFCLTFSRRLDQQIINSLFMNPNENSSCAKVSTPEPAQYVTLHKVENGWHLSTDYSFKGTERKSYVYARPEEVAGAVLGLIVAGYPVPAVYPGPQKVTLCNIDEEKEKSRAEGFAACQKQSNDALEEVKEAAFHDGYSMGRKNANECRVTASQVNDAQRRGRIEGLRQADEELSKLQAQNGRLERLIWVAETSRDEARRIVQNQSTLLESHLKEIKELRKEVNAAGTKNVVAHAEGYKLGRKDESREWCGRRPWNEIFEKDGLITSLRQEVADANARVNTAYDNGVVSGREQTMKTVSNIAPEFRVGDVWRDRHGHIRCITKIDGGGFTYQHTFPGGITTEDTAYDARDFRGNVGPDATVTRNFFSPAKFPGEPAEGFCVGDVWELSYGDTRTVLIVSSDSIAYKYVCCPGRSLGAGIYTHVRGKDLFRLNVDGATLVRK